MELLMVLLVYDHIVTTLSNKSSKRKLVLLPLLLLNVTQATVGCSQCQNN